MNSSILWGNPFRKVPSDVKEELRFLSSVPIFDTLSQGQLRKIHKLIHVRRYKREEIVFRQGDPGVGMYIVRDGQIDVYHEFADMTKTRITTLKAGDFFGEIALLNEISRSATAVASTDSTLFGLFRPDLLDVMDSDPKLGLKIIYRIAQIIAERLRLSTSEISK